MNLHSWGGGGGAWVLYWASSCVGSMQSCAVHANQDILLQFPAIPNPTCTLYIPKNSQSYIRQFPIPLKNILKHQVVGGWCGKLMKITCK